LRIGSGRDADDYGEKQGTGKRQQHGNAADQQERDERDLDQLLVAGIHGFTRGSDF
jgi:hypothetical protein